MVFLLLPDFALADDGVTWAQKLVWVLVINITGLVLGLGGMLLDVGINTFVIGFGDLYRSSGLGVAVNNVWIILRDFINLGFVFGLVYIGFRMILDSSNSNTRRWLVQLIIAALLINFSLLATKFVIDFTNELSAQIAVEGFSGQPGPNGIHQVEMSKMIVDKMGIGSIFGGGVIKNKGIENLAAGQGWGYIFGTGILFLVAGFVFAAGGILLMIRFIVLHLFMVLSPLMFIGWVLPFVGDQMSKYWKMFFGRAFFAPVYLLLLYLSVRIIDGLKESTRFSRDKINFADTFNGNGGEILNASQSTLPFFIMICGFMIASIVVAQKMSADGASQAISVGKSLNKRANRFAMSKTLGTGALVAGAASKRMLNTYERMDANVQRRSPLARNLIRGAAAVGTLGLATDKNVRSALKAGQKLSVAGSESFEQYEKRNTDTNIARNQKIAEMDRETQIEDFNRQIDETATTAQELNDAFNGLGRTIRQMGNDERAGLGFATLSSGRVAMHLTDSHIEALEKSGQYSLQEIQSIRNARNQAYVSIANGGYHPTNIDANGNYQPINPTFDVLPQGRQLQNPLEMRNFQTQQRQAVVNRDVKSAGNMEVAVFTNPEMAAYLTPQVLEERMRNGGVQNNQLNTIRTNIETEINNGLSIGAPAALRARDMWNNWTQRSTYGAQLGLRFNAPAPAPAITPPAPANSSGIIMPGQPGWNQANSNLPPRPGAQP